MTRLLRGLAIAAAAALALCAPALAQNATAARGRAAAVVVESLSPEAADPLIARILTSGLDEALSTRGIRVAPAAAAAAGAAAAQLPDEQRVSRVLGARKPEGVDVVVAAFYLNERDQLFVQFVLYDPAIDTVLGGVLTRARQGLTVFESVSAAVADFDPIIRRYIEGGYYAAKPAGLVESITITGATRGADVFFVDRQVGTVGGGDLFVPFTQFEVGTPLRLRMSKDGYHELEQTRPLDAAKVTLAVPELRRETRFDLGLRWSWGEALGVGFGARFHIVPDQLFVALEHYRAFEPAGGDGARDVQHYDTSVSVGRYLVFSYRSPIRLSLNVGAGAIVSDVDDLAGREYTDWYILVGNPTLELNLDRMGFFVRPELKYALGLGYNTLGRVWVRVPYATDSGVFAMPPITIGVRYSW
jgi:hypothetical protein